EPYRVLVVREERAELVPEDGGAPRLQADDGHARLNLGAERVQDPAEVELRPVQHSPVVERPSAAEPGRRDAHPVAGVLEHLEGGGERAGLEVVVEGVGPEDDGRPARVPRAPATVPGAEGPGREARDPTL